MIPESHNANKQPFTKRVLLSLIAVLCVAGITLTVLKLANPPRATDANTQPTRKESSIDSLRSGAFTKLKTGDQAGGVKDLEQALALAKQANNEDQISYLEQQLDFAKNSALPNTQNTAVAPPSLSENDPQQVKIQPSN